MNIQKSVPGIELERKDFTPHVTLLKLRGQDQDHPKLKPETYSPFIMEDFGNQILTPIELVAMHEHDEEGYYKCYGRLHMSGFFEKFIH